MDMLPERLKSMGTPRLLALAGSLAAGAGLLFWAFHHMAVPAMTLLAGDLYPADAGKIVARMETLNVPFELRGDGSAVYVPADRAVRLRMQLAEEGLTTGSVVGNEIFDRTDTLGMTSFLQDIHQLRALEGELARTIGSLKPVASARVHLVMPKKSLFTQDHQTPTASVILKMRHQGRLAEGQIRAIRHVVASAVPGLGTDAISVVDDQGTLLARGDQEEGKGASASHMDDIARAQEERLSRAVESLLEKTLGAGKVKARVSVELDFDHTTENAELFDPEGQVVRSTQTAEDGNQSHENSNTAVTIQNNLPAPPNAAPVAPKTSNQSRKAEETTNYEISRTVRQKTRETGSVRRLSVAVLVDGHYTSPDDPRSWTARSPQEMEQIRQLVASATGFQEARGDRIEVINMPFVQPEGSADREEAGFWSAWGPGEWLRLGETALMTLGGLLGLWLLSRALGGIFPGVSGMARQAGQSAGNANNDPADAGEEPVATSAALQDNMRTAAEMAQDQKIRKSNLAVIEEIIRQNPDESTSMIRNWIHGEI